MGMLSLRAEGRDRYTQEHAELISMLHDPFAIAMANALKHRELLCLKNMLDDDNTFLKKQLMDLSGSEIIGADAGDMRAVMSAPVRLP